MKQEAVDKTIIAIGIIGLFIYGILLGAIIQVTFEQANAKQTELFGSKDVNFLESWECSHEKTVDWKYHENDSYFEPTLLEDLPSDAVCLKQQDVNIVPYCCTYWIADENRFAQYTEHRCTVWKTPIKECDKWVYTRQKPEFTVTVS